MKSLGENYAGVKNEATEFEDRGRGGSGGIKVRGNGAASLKYLHYQPEL